MRVRVKICGITSDEDARVAIEAGADALGFMFYEPSPRFLTLAAAEAVSRNVPPFVARVGVFVNPTADFVRQVMASGAVDTLQFHGDESPEFCRQFGMKVIKAFRIRDRASLDALKPYDREALLLDSYVPGQPGGTGAQFNWDLAVEAKFHSRPILLAGGLNPDNAAAAVRQVRPYGLDVSSGVESSPGRKSPDKVRRFIAAVREAGA